MDLERLSMKKTECSILDRKGHDAEIKSINRGQYLTHPQPAGGTTGSSAEAAHTEDPSL